MAGSAVSHTALASLLRERWGHDQFRPGQKLVVRYLLDGADVRAVFPTGAGKSLVNRVTAQVLPGLTLVV